MNKSQDRVSAFERKGPKFISAEQLCADDVILCYKDKKIDVIGSRIQKVTDSAYTHAAICIGSGQAAESKIWGVKISDIRDLASRYDHVAIFRQPHAWSVDRIKTLRLFVKSFVSKGVKYNFSGVLKFRQQRNEHEQTLPEQLNAFFEGTLDPPQTEKRRCFCSELVVDCFVKTGFIKPSAAVVYKSNVTSPGALGRDPTSGTFYGYLSYVENYQIPETDEFFNATTFNEIFENEI